MTGIMEVLRNPGDFAASMVGLDPTRRQVEAFTGWDGDMAYRDQDREPGYGRVNPVNLRNNQVYGEYKRAGQLIKKVFEGNDYARLLFRDAMRGSRNVREALAISDFPNLFGDVIDRQVLANYMETPYTWNMVAKLGEVSDFRQVKRFRVDGGTGLLGALDSSGNMIPVPLGGQYPEDKLVDAKYSYYVQKYGKRMPFFWETFINDDLNGLKDTPARFGMGARRSEEYFVTKLFANNTTFFSLANNNIVSSAIANLTAAPPTSFVNPPLTVTGLQQAMLVMMSQRDTTGHPIGVTGYTLVVGPGLSIQAENILHQTQIIMAQSLGGDTNAQGFPTQLLQMNNWLSSKFSLAVNFELPIVDTTYGNKGWYIFANPNSGRPAMEFGKLRGHTNPELFMKLPNSVAISEGAMGPGAGVMPGTQNMNPMEGDFDTDSIHYKVRSVFGGTVMDPICAVYSNGSNA